MPNIFISYRRADAGGMAGRVADRLKAHFGDTRVFIDVADIPPGEDFRACLARTMDRCDVCLVLIGRRWLDGERLHDTDDHVRNEVEQALQNTRAASQAAVA